MRLKDSIIPAMTNNGAIQSKNIMVASLYAFLRLSIFLPFLNSDKNIVNPKINNIAKVFIVIIIVYEYFVFFMNHSLL